MRKSFKVFTTFLIAAMLTFTVAACNSTGNISHYDYMNPESDYNRTLFYQNDLQEKAADPCVIYIDHGRDEGYYYMYATSDQIGATGYQAWRSKNLSDWECTGAAFIPPRNGWSKQNHWAPEVIYYQTPEEKEAGTDGKYYLFYNAWNSFNSNRHSIGLAISDTPDGPFELFTGVTKDGRNVTVRDPYLDSDLFPVGSAARGMAFIDASPFVDDDGKLYLYITQDFSNNVNTSSIWGLPLKDIFSPDYAKVVQLTKYNRPTVDSNESMGETNNTNEAPFMIRHNSKYYLTFSISQYFQPSYSVAQAIGESPLGPFTKVAYKDGGKLLTYEGNSTDDFFEENYDHMSGTGHHSFIRVGEELYIAYHAFVDRVGANIGLGRAIAVDRATFVNNGKHDVLYASGATYSVQPLPAASAEYKNIAGLASVTCKDTSDDSDVSYLTDGIFKVHNYAFINEFESKKDSATITLKFDKAYNIRAVMVYNSFYYANSFSKVDSINIKGGGTIKNLRFDDEKHLYVIDESEREGVMRPGGAAIAEFYAISSKEIVIKINSRFKNQPLKISEIVILGSEV